MTKISFEVFGDERKKDQIEIAQKYLNQDKQSFWFADIDRFIEEKSGEIVFTDQLNAIIETAEKVQAQAKYMVCIGIGGSYLGHKAIIEALQPESATQIIFVGNSLSNVELDRALKKLDEADFVVNVISKSGTTLEPAIAFRILKQKLIEKYGAEEAKNRIYATTDPEAGALHDEAVQNCYQMFEIPKNVGGRFSVFTAVGLLPMAVAGVNIKELVKGAYSEKNSSQDTALRYAVTRYELMRKGFATEVMTTFEPAAHYLQEWWKQLFGESEGKHANAILPTNLVYSTDLHSMGQFIQEGRRDIFETFLSFENNAANDFSVEAEEQNLDGLNRITGKKISELNKIAELATMRAHVGDATEKFIPVFKIRVPHLDEQSLGALMAFFMSAAVTSAHLQSVNPYDQPGVEAYKAEMKKLLST